MAETESDIDYAVLVTERDGTFELRIRELLLVVRGPVPEKAYEELMMRKSEILDSARAFGTLDEVPQAERPALFVAARPGVVRSFLTRLGWI